MPSVIIAKLYCYPIQKVEKAILEGHICLTDDTYKFPEFSFPLVFATGPEAPRNLGFLDAGGSYLGNRRPRDAKVAPSSKLLLKGGSQGNLSVFFDGVFERLPFPSLDFLRAGDFPDARAGLGA